MAIRNSRKIIAAILVITAVALCGVAAIIVAKGGGSSVTSSPANQSTAFRSRTPRVPTRTLPPAGRITEFPLPTSASEPFGITVGPDGNLWFTEEVGNSIGRITA